MRRKEPHDPAVVRIGCDIGKVISGGDTDSEQSTMFSDDYLQTPAVTGAIETLAWLQAQPGIESIRLLSYCKERMEQKSRQWLDHVDFWRRTGIPRQPDSLQFVRARPEKAVYARRWELTHFVDDRFDCLGPMAGLPSIETLFWFRPKPGQLVPMQLRPVIIPVADWAEIRESFQLRLAS